jgi:DNA-binding response OmpR family regulator
MSAKILIVEDDPDIRRGLSIRLRVNNYETVFAYDGISAVAAAEREKPDLILLDLGLPAGDGFVVMERLEKLAPNVPVIVLSARDPLLNRERALAAGARAFLQKPAENDELLEAISSALGQEKGIPASLGEAGRNSAKILIVEDDEDIRRGLSIRLRASKYDTIFASDGISAVKSARHESPDLVLLDLGLPGGDGFVVMERMRVFAPELPVIVLSARDPLLNRERALAAGALAFLQKPVETEELLQAIRRGLHGQASHTSAGYDSDRVVLRAG